MLQSSFDRTTHIVADNDGQRNSTVGEQPIIQEALLHLVALLGSFLFVLSLFRWSKADDFGWSVCFHHDCRHLLSNVWMLGSQIVLLANIIA